jgi:hypothetical protein
MLVHAETVSAAAPVAAAPRKRLRDNWKFGDWEEEDSEEETDVMLMMPF